MKKILSILLCLCMVAVLLPTTALAATPVENVTFTHAYDVQRNPAFPSVTNLTITLNTLKRPLIGDNDDDRVDNNGRWTLARVGTYSYVTGNHMNTNKLNTIVDSVATAYDISEDDEKGTIVIHELKNGGTHIAYGVVLAYSETATENMAVFVGDLWNSSGAGYLLSTKAKTGPVTVTAGMIATDFANQTDSIVLAPDGDYTFPEATEGYGEQTPLTVTVTNTGTVATEQLQVNSTDVNEEKFDLSKNTIDSIAPNETATFTITPKTGLAAGTYTATVTVSNTNVVPQSIVVSFTVTASPSTPVVIIVPDDTADTTDPAKNPETGDNSTHLLWAVMASSALCAAALLFSSRRRGEEMQ